MSKFCCTIKPLTVVLAPDAFRLSEPDEWEENKVSDGSSDSTPLSYEGGFSVNEELTDLDIHPTFSNRWAPYVYLWEDDPKKFERMTKKIPVVKQNLEFTPPTEITEEFKYSLYTYKVANPPDEMVDKDQKFIFTGSMDMTADTSVTKNVMIPLNELEKRLGANGYTLEDRRQAYIQDWLTFAAAALAFDYKNKTSHSADIPRWTLPPIKEEDIPDLSKAFDGSHLAARTTWGEFRKDGVVKFLAYLLAPKSQSKVGTNLGEYIFRRWCNVAYAAAIAAKDPFSVKARFWPIPGSLHQELDFICVKPKGLTTDGIQELRNFQFLQTANPVNANAFLEKLYNMAIINDMWTKAVEEAFTRVEVLAGKPAARSFRPLPDNEFTVQWQQTHFKLGEHPQGLYSIWVSNEHMEKMMEKGYYSLEDLRQFPADLGFLSDDMKSDAPTTRTVITQEGINTASNWPRYPSQFVAMKNTSATDVATVIWGQRSLRVAEWLHRSAYSYGGIVKGDPSSSQVMGNLVFGTYECNTTMIRHEAYIKRLVDAGPPGFIVALQTDVTQEDPPYSWFVRELDYAWIFKVPEAWPGWAINNTHVFKLFSRHYPTLFEIMFDEAFDTVWWGGGKQPAWEDVRDMCERFLVATQGVQLVP